MATATLISFTGLRQSSTEHTTFVSHVPPATELSPETTCDHFQILRKKNRSTQFQNLKKMIILNEIDVRTTTQVDLDLSPSTLSLTSNEMGRGHTLGFAHCSSFQNRIHNFNTQKEVDPTLNPSFAASLEGVCPAHNTVKNAGAAMDESTTSFDNVYYKMLMQGKSLFSSYQALLTTSSTRKLVAKRAFVKSMIKMGSISGNGNEVRLNCRRVR